MPGDINLTLRENLDEADTWRVRNFLREVFLLNGRREHSWHTARLDYWRAHLFPTCGARGPVEQVTSLWETGGGEIAAALHPVFPGEVFLHVHPKFRSAALETEMIAYAERRWSGPAPLGGLRLFVPAYLDDGLRQDWLARRGYRRYGRPVHHWRRDLDVPIPEASAPPGYAIRSMGDLDEHPARSWASWRAFHAGEPDSHYDGDPSWFKNVQSAPLYRRDLDLVAAAPDGGIAAFCTIYYDDFTRSAVCVLVGTAFEHQRRGLGRAVMAAGLQRLRDLGCTRAFANAYDPPADGLYGSILGTKEVSETWVKVFPAD